MNEQQELSTKSRDELNVIGKRLLIANYRRLNREQLIDAISNTPSSPKQKLSSWWERYHNHVYGLASILGVFLTIVIWYWPVAVARLSPSSVAQFNEFGHMTLNLERRNSLQNKTFADWIKKTRDFKRTYPSERPPTKDEYDAFILQFTEFAESNFTPLQVKSFRGLETGAGGPMFKDVDKIPEELRDQFIQLALIEYWLIQFTDLNRRGEEPIDWDKISV